MRPHLVLGTECIKETSAITAPMDERWTFENIQDFQNIFLDRHVCRH